MRADDLGAVGASDAAGTGDSVTMGHPGRNPVWQGDRARDGIQ